MVINMFFILTAVCVFLVDLVFKGYVENKFEIGQEKEYAKGNIVITRCHNSGAAMGKLAGNTDKLIFMSKFMTALCFVYFIILLPFKGKKLNKSGLSLIISGGLQNLYDRLVKGSVTDYIRIPKAPGNLKNIIFNISDIAVMSGCMFVGMAELFKGKK